MDSLGLIKADLKSYKVLITGGGSGIGYSTSCLFAKMGATVAINYLPNDQEAQHQINKLKLNYENIIDVPGDVSDEIDAKK